MDVQTKISLKGQRKNNSVSKSLKIKKQEDLKSLKSGYQTLMRSKDNYLCNLIEAFNDYYQILVNEVDGVLIIVDNNKVIFDLIQVKSNIQNLDIDISFTPKIQMKSISISYSELSSLERGLNFFEFEKRKIFILPSHFKLYSKAKINIVEEGYETEEIKQINNIEDFKYIVRHANQIKIAQLFINLLESKYTEVRLLSDYKIQFPCQKIFNNLNMSLLYKVQVREELKEMILQRFSSQPQIQGPKIEFFLKDPENPTIIFQYADLFKVDSVLKWYRQKNKKILLPNKCQNIYNQDDDD